ncbi:MAG: hypothetical protein ACOC14_05225 [Bacillota bacterium]
MPFSIPGLPEISDTVFLVIAIFLIVELLSQLLKFELIGKIYIQFYVVVMHLMITLALVRYDSRELTIYFITLIAFVNSIRFIFYKVPLLKYNKSARFIFDLLVVGGLTFLLYNLVDLIHLNLRATSLDTEAKYALLLSLGMVLIYEMIQRAKEIGLDIRDYLPRTMASFFIVGATIVGVVYMLFTAFTGSGDALLELYRLVPLFIGGIILIMGLVSLIKREDYESYSILFVLPTFTMFILFISVFTR